MMMTMKIKQKDFNPVEFRKLYASWTPEQKENYEKNLKRKMTFERGRRAAKLEALLEP